MIDIIVHEMQIEKCLYLQSAVFLLRLFSSTKCTLVGKPCSCNEVFTTDKTAQMPQYYVINLDNTMTQVLEKDILSNQEIISKIPVTAKQRAEISC